MAQWRAARQALATAVRGHEERLIELCARLVQAPSENPPGDTRVVAAVAAELLRQVPGAEVEEVAEEPAIANVVARIRGSGPGRRLVFNGHLDTFPVGDPSTWTVDPFGGAREHGRVYGRGVSDMKGGIACSLLAVELLASCREAWRGEVVLTLAGDEETMGTRGTAHLLETVPYARGDAMICGDAGSPHVLRFGEKGFVWLDVVATGRAAHGAHVHAGENAIERLLAAVERLLALRGHPVRGPAAVVRSIGEAREVSEALSGAGESRTLTTVTVNCGVVRGGSSPVGSVARVGSPRLARLSRGDAGSGRRPPAGSPGGPPPLGHPEVWPDARCASLTAFAVVTHHRASLVQSRPCRLHPPAPWEQRPRSGVMLTSLLVQAATLLVSAYFVAINLLLDVLYVSIDPRIRLA